MSQTKQATNQAKPVLPLQTQSMTALVSTTKATTDFMEAWEAQGKDTDVAFPDALKKQVADLLEQVTDTGGDALGQLLCAFGGPTNRADLSMAITFLKVTAILSLAKEMLDDEDLAPLLEVLGDKRNFRKHILQDLEDNMRKMPPAMLERIIQLSIFMGLGWAAELQSLPKKEPQNEPSAD